MKNENEECTNYARDIAVRNIPRVDNKLWRKFWKNSGSKETKVHICLRCWFLGNVRVRDLNEREDIGIIYSLSVRTLSNNHFHSSRKLLLLRRKQPCTIAERGE